MGSVSSFCAHSKHRSGEPNQRAMMRSITDFTHSAVGAMPSSSAVALLTSAVARLTCAVNALGLIEKA